MDRDADARDRWRIADRVAVSRASGRVAVVQTSRPTQAPAILADDAAALWDALAAGPLSVEAAVAQASIPRDEAIGMLEALEDLGLVIRT